MPGQGSKKSKRLDTRPARSKYWATKKLRTNKVHAIMGSTTLSEKQALKMWESQRRGRMKGF